LEEFARRVSQELQEPDWDTRREVVRALVKKVEIDEQEVRIVYRVSPSPFEGGPQQGSSQHCWGRGFTRPGELDPRWTTTAAGGTLREHAAGTRQVQSPPIARYSAAISDGLREGTGCCRGGIAGRWTKPAVASPVCDVLSEAISLSRTRFGELYPASRDAASLDSSSKEGS
jgi:hypothetical protein